jgi:hypothetical protein
MTMQQWIVNLAIQSDLRPAAARARVLLVHLLQDDGTHRVANPMASAYARASIQTA